jgi:hypothetical protein
MSADKCDCGRYFEEPVCSGCGSEECECDPLEESEKAEESATETRRDKA